MIEGSSHKKNGSINSNTEAPVYIRFYYFFRGLIMDEAALIRCFVSQACHLGHLFSAHAPPVFQ